MISNGFGDLGFGWRSFYSAAKKVGKGAYSVASLPAKAAMRVASATSGVLCNKDGTPRSSDSTSRNFCRALQVKNYAAVRRYLPAATRVANQYRTAQRVYSAGRGALSAADDQLLSLANSGSDADLSFALAGVDPGEIGAVFTKSDFVDLAPASLAVAVGLWVLFRG